MREGPKFYGPYKEPNGQWRVVGIGADGKRAAQTFASEAAAIREIEKARRQSETRTMNAAVDAFIAAERERGLRSSSTERSRFHLRRVLQLDGNGHRMLSWLTPSVAERLYLESQRGAVDTQRGGLAVARQFGAWCATKGWLKVSPFGAIRGRGRRKHGKPQLRIDEGRKFLERCVELADDGDQGAVLALGYLFLGIRNTELVARVVRDLDDNGRVLWIDDAKCERSKRPVEIPEWLRPYFRALTKDKLPAAPLFQGRSGRARARDWATDQIPRICTLAGVSRVTPHGLRGMAATYASIGGANHDAIAKALGHDVSEMRRSYLDGSAVAETQRDAVLALLGGAAGEGLSFGKDPGRSFPRLTRPTENLSANGGTRTPTVLPTGT